MQIHSDLVQKYISGNKANTILNTVLCSLIVIWLFIMFFQLKKSEAIIQEDIKANTIHDTVYVKPPKVYYCWNCKKELVGIAQGAVKCCGFEYTVQNGELIAKKLGE